MWKARVNSVLPFVNLSSHYYTLCLSWSKQVPEGFPRIVPEEAGTDTRECSAGSWWMGKEAVVLLCRLCLRSWWWLFEKALCHCEPKLHLIESKSPGAFVLHKRAAQSRGTLFRYKCLHEVLESSGFYTDLVQLLSSQTADQSALKYKFVQVKEGLKHFP